MTTENPDSTETEPTIDDPEVTEAGQAAGQTVEAAAAAGAEVKASTPAADKPKVSRGRKGKASEGDSEEGRAKLHAAAADVLGVYESEVIAVDVSADDEVIATTMDGQRYQLHGPERGDFTWLKQA